MTIDAKEIEKAVRDSDESRVRELLRDATEAERRACARELETLLAGLGEPGTHLPHRLSGTPAFGVTAVGLARGAAPAYRAWQWVDLGVGVGQTPGSVRDAIVGVLADRKPRWLAAFADRLLRTEWMHARWMYWQIVRDLVNLGLIDKPERPEYTTAMLVGIRAWDAGRMSLLRGLRADPGLLDDEVWRLFTVPEAGAELDRNGGWDGAFMTLAADGTISRDRLLDACLDAFVRDFPPNHVGWYLALHDQLAPSLKEKAARTGKYLALLSASGKTGVTFGQRECGLLLDAGLLDPRAFLAASATALLFPVKLVMTAHLKLVDALVKTHPEVREEALATVAIAFAHEREDAQAAALKLIRKHGVPAGEAARAAIERLTAALSPVIAPDAVALGLAAETPPRIVSAAAPSSDVPAAAPRSGAPSGSRVHPVEDPDELIQLLARLLEDAADMLAVERAVAGAVRLASLPLAERARLAAPLLKRAAAQTWPDATWISCQTENHMSYLVMAWAAGEVNVRRYPEWMDRWENAWPRLASSPDPAQWDPADPRHGVLSARLWEACHLIIAGPGGPLLAEPEFTDGTIGQATLLRRLTSWRPGSGGPPRNDVETALLRLALGADDAFWAEWDAAPAGAPPAGAARAMYDDGHAALEFEPVFIPASKATRPGQRDQLPGALGRNRAPEAAISQSRCWRAAAADPADPERGASGGYAGVWGLRRELPLLLPHQPELAAANLLLPLSGGLEAGRPASLHAAESLPDIGTADGRKFGRMCHLALVTGLASVNPDTRLTAVSAWVRVSLEGRLDPGLAAAAIAGGVSAGAFKLKRIAGSLGHAALDPAATAGVGAACVTASAALLPARPRDLHLLLELATRCFTSVTASALPEPPGLPTAIGDLARSGDRTKLADAARRLARLGLGPGSRLRPRDPGLLSNAPRPGRGAGP